MKHIPDLYREIKTKCYYLTGQETAPIFTLCNKLSLPQFSYLLTIYITRGERSYYLKKATKSTV